MVGIQTTNEIIKHRALGLSYSDIETTTGVSRPTVIKICREHVNDIAEAREIASIIAYKDMATTISKRRLAYTRLWHKGFEELMGRDWSQFSSNELIKLMGTAERTLTLLESNDKTSDDWLLPPMGIARAKKIIDGVD